MDKTVFHLVEGKTSFLSVTSYLASQHITEYILPRGRLQTTFFFFLITHFRVKVKFFRGPL